MTNPWKLLTHTEAEFGRDHCTQLAAAIAYHVVFAFIPLLTVLLAGVGLVLRDPQQQQAAVDRILSAVPLQSGTLIYDMIRSLSTQTGTLTVIGLLGLVWAASGLFGTIRAALNIAWGVQHKRGFITDKLLDLGAVLGLAILLTASLAGTVMLHFLQTLSSTQSISVLTGPLQSAYTVAGVALPAVFSFMAFLLLYRYVPNVRHSVSDVLPGALAATILFELAKHGFAVYVSHFNHYQALYGVLGAVMLFMLWTYVSAIILLIGAELAAAQETLSGRREVEQEPAVVLHGQPHSIGR